jgi:hypothetical protein
VEERLKATLDAFAQFEDNYPKSGYLEDLKHTYNKTIQSLTELKPNKNEI